MKYTFSNKVVLVTGAASGIGESIAEHFGKFGAQLVLVDKDETNLKKNGDECHKMNQQKVVTIVANIGIDEECQNVFDTTIKEFGRLDILINCAGVGGRGTIQNTDMSVFDKVFNVNVRAAYNLTRLFAPSLIESKGNIVNISSIVGSVPDVRALPYSMSKAALNHFTKCVSMELAGKGVRVNAVAPGLTESNFYKGLQKDATEEKYQEWLNEYSKNLGIPMGQACKPEDIAKMVVHIASDDSRLVTGTIIEVDGGLKPMVPSFVQVMKSS